MSEIGKELMRLLKEIYDNQDFVCGAMSNAGSEKAWEKMRDYIVYAKAHEHEVSSDELLLLSLSLGEKETESEHAAVKKGLKVAML